MAKDELIGSRASISQCKKAISALIKHATKVAKQKEETELLPGKEENVWLVLSVKKVMPEKKLKPFKIPVAHPIVDPRTNSICLITKDPQREYKDLLESHNIKFITRVVGITKLKGKFKPFEARRMLMKENDLFLADERVVPLLPGLLGKAFFKAKKQPIPVSLTKKDLKKELEQAVSSTYMHLNQGTCTSIKIATVSQSPAHVLENLKTALPAIVERLMGGWDNVQSFHIKTNSSTSLPVWSCNLGDGENGRWEKIDAEHEVEEEQAGDESDSDEPVTKTTSAGGKKRPANEGSKPPSKKAKKSALKSSVFDTQPPAEKTPAKKGVPAASGTASTKEELKQKRVTFGIEKKKEKLIKGKPRGSIKESVVGKRSKTRIYM